MRTDSAMPPFTHASVPRIRPIEGIHCPRKLRHVRRWHDRKAIPCQTPMSLLMTTRARRSTARSSSSFCDLVHKRLVQAVFVHDLDRLSRKLAHQLLLSEEFEQVGVALRIVAMPDGATTPKRSCSTMCEASASTNGSRYWNGPRAGGAGALKMGTSPMAAAR